MTLVKEYITWVAFHNNNGITHINPNMTKNWVFVTTTELNYGNTETDKRRLGIVEYDDTEFLQKHKDRYIVEGSPFGVTFKTPQEAVDLCNEWYPAPGSEADYFELGSDDFTIIDNRPEEE